MLCVNHGISAEAAPVVTAHRSSPTPELIVRVSGSASGSRVSKRHREHTQMRITQRVLKIFPHTQIQVREGLGGLLRNGTVTQEKWWRGTDREGHAGIFHPWKMPSVIGQPAREGQATQSPCNVLFLSPLNCPHPTSAPGAQEPTVETCINHAFCFLYFMMLLPFEAS